MTLTAYEIDSLAQWRTMQFADMRAQWDILAAIWRGAHKDLFPDEFPAEEVPKVAGFIRRSAKMFGRLVGQVPDAYVSPLAETAKALADQDRIEKILAGYNDVWAMELKMGVLANYEVLMGAAAVGVIPDPRAGYPIMLVEDPRNCVDEDTEILTKRGWLRHTDLTTDDEVAGYDLDTGLARWTHCLGVHRYQHDGAMIAVDRRTLSMRLTPDHRCVVQKRVSHAVNQPGPIEVVRAIELNGWHYIPRSAEWMDYGEKSIGTNLAALLGWVASEGWYDSNCVWLCQSKSANPDKVKVIDGLVPVKGVRRTERVRKGYDGRPPNILVEWRLPFGLGHEIQRLMPRKRLEPWCLDLPEDERRALLMAFIEGDGSKQKKGTGYIVYQNERENLDVLQAVAVTLGFKTHIAWCGHHWLLYLSRGGPASLRRRTWRNQTGEPVIPTEHHEGLVWCPTTGTGTWFARRNGSVFVTGNCLPGAGWSSTGISTFGWPAYDLTNLRPANDAGGGQLEDCIIRKAMTAKQIKVFDPGSQALEKVLGSSQEQLHRTHTVVMYYDDADAYMVLGGTGILLNQSPHGAPWCPWWFPTNFCFDSGAGDSDYYQQIGLEVAYSTLLSQKLALNDAVVFPWLAKKGIWEIDPATRSMQATSPDAAVQTLSPPPTFQVDRDMALLQNDLRTLNMETEATQGQLPGGPITGQGIQQLNQAPVVETVQDYFRKNGWLLPRVYATALIQDREVFPNKQKDISSWARGETFFTSYTPAKDIGTRLGRIVVDFGPGLGGYQGHIAQLQDLGADTMSKLTVMEKNRSIRSVRAERARMWQQKLDALVEASLTGQTAVPPDWISRAYLAVGEGKDFHEWALANPPGQATATPENVPPVPPGSLPPPGPPGAGGPAGFLGPAAPTPPGLPAGQGGVGPGPAVFSPPPLAKLVGR
jgi:hypothetical protein